ncbi:MAG: hypothetical protein AAGI07_00215, partial [Bacteroidota bacterium]
SFKDTYPFDFAKAPLNGIKGIEQNTKIIYPHSTSRLSRFKRPFEVETIEPIEKETLLLL